MAISCQPSAIGCQLSAFRNPLWEHMDSNQGPSACKADALNQLSYAPFFHLRRAKIRENGEKEIGDRRYDTGDRRQKTGDRR